MTTSLKRALFLGLMMSTVTFAQSGTIPFIITVKTDNAGSSNNDQFILSPGAGTFDFTVECDGQTITRTNGWPLTLTFPSGPGTYDVSITGTFPSLYYQGEDDAKKIVDVKQWGNLAWKSMPFAFIGCSNLNVSAADTPDLSAVTDLSYMFQGCSSLTSLDTSAWDVSNVTTMLYLFAGCSTLPTIDVTNWDVSKVTDMSYLFAGCTTLETLDVSGWNVGTSTSMRNMFTGCHSLASLDVKNWDVSMVTTMRFMFYQCRALTTLDVGGWNVANVTDMEGMFQGCIAMTSYVGIENWDISKVTSISAMFRYNLQLQRLNLTGWDTSNVADISWMFYRCYNLRELIGYENWDVSKVSSFYYLFERVLVPTFDISNWKTSDQLTGLTYMFVSSGTHTVIGLDALDVTNVKYAEDIFLNSTIIVSTQQYDALLIAWDLDVLAPAPNTVTFNIDARYTGGGAAEVARTSLIAKNWNIIDKGVASNNTPPTANDDSITLAKNTSQAITLGGSDLDGDLIHYTVIDAPVNGTLTGSGSDLTFTPSNNVVGTDSFTFQTFDGTDTSNLATVSITVTNTAPVADDQTVEAFWNSDTSITLTGRDADGDTLTYAIIDTASNGSLAITDNVVTYTPNPDFLGPDAFTFKANDGNDDGNVATVTITVYNNIPIADSQTVKTYENTPLALTLSATHYSGSPLTYTIVTAPVSGMLSGTPPSVEYTPEAGFTGSDSFTFAAEADGETSNTATVSIEVGPSLVARYTFDDPLAPWQDRSLYTNHGTPVSSPVVTSGHTADSAEFSGTNYLTIPDSDSLDISQRVTLMGWIWLSDDTGDQNMLQKGTNYGLFEIRGGGTPKNVLHINGEWKVFDYSQPASYFLGGWHHVAVTYDGTTVTNYLDGVEDSSVAQSGLMTVNDDSMALGANAPWLDAGFKGKVDEVRIYGRALTPAEIAEIYASNSIPVAYDRVVSMNANTTRALTLMASDLDNDSLTFSIADAPANGSIAGTPPAITYTPTPGFNGIDSFTFTASDGADTSNMATVTLTVDNLAPVIDSEAMASPSSIFLGETVELSVFASDPNGDPLTYSWSKLSGSGTISFSTNGTSLSNQTAATFSEVDSYEVLVTVSDGLLSATSSVSVTVAANSAPVAEAQSVSTHWSQSLPITLSGVDPQGRPLTYNVSTPPANGSVSGIPPTSAYSSNTGFKGIDSFEFTVSDGVLTSLSATVTVEVTNTPPVADPATTRTLKNSSKDITLTGSDTDGDSLSFTIVTNPVNGTLSGVAPNLTYMPNTDFTGTDAITFTAFDGLDESSPESITITVNAPARRGGSSGGCSATHSQPALPIPLLLLLVSMIFVRHRVSRLA